MAYDRPYVRSALMARTDPRPNYGSKRRVRADGYIDIYEPAHPIARRDGYVFEHRKVMWDAGELVDPKMEVHHLNHDRGDNRPDNLEVTEGGDHTRLHGLKGTGLRNANATHCPQGHPYTEENTYNYSYGRFCKTCVRKRTREYHRKRRAA